MDKIKGFLIPEAIIIALENGVIINSLWEDAPFEITPSQLTKILNKTVERNEKAVDTVVELNREMLLKRSQVGVKKYGVTLDKAELTQLEGLTHALEEALDLANYLQMEIQKLKGN